MNVSDVTYAYKRYALHERGITQPFIPCVEGTVIGRWYDTGTSRRIAGEALIHELIQGYGARIRVLSPLFT